MEREYCHNLPHSVVPVPAVRYIAVRYIQGGGELFRRRLGGKALDNMLSE